MLPACVAWSDGSSCLRVIRAGGPILKASLVPPSAPSADDELSLFDQGIGPFASVLKKYGSQTRVYSSDVVAASGITGFPLTSTCPSPCTLTASVRSFSDPDSVPSITTSSLSGLVFASRLRVDVLQRCVRYQLAVRRGKRLARSKTRGETSGSGKKVRPQKGGGTSRAGDRRPPHWKGGGSAHGPKGTVVDYGDIKLNKKFRELGVITALSERMREGNIRIVDKFEVKEDVVKGGLVKTKDVAGLIAKAAGDEKGDLKVLLLSGGGFASQGASPSFILACRNLPHVHVLSAGKGINVYDIMRNERIVIDLKGLEEITKRFTGKGGV